MNRRPTDITGSRQRRQRARRIRLVLRGLIVAGVLGVLAGITWVVGFSQAFAATSVHVRGTAVLTPEEVTHAAQVPIGTPLIRFDAAPVRARVSALAPVASVDVSRSLPNDVVITVTERQPAYVLRDAHGTLSLVDRTGVVYFATESAPAGLLQAQVATPETRLLRDVATVVAALPPTVRDQAMLVMVESVDHIVIRLEGNRQLVWGSAEQSDLKAQVAAALLVTPASVYDVSAPSHPATKA